MEGYNFHSDLTFITNEAGQSLKNRFEELIKDSRYFDCLVGYFYLSGFHSIYKSLENTEKIRILIGISVSKNTYDTLNQAKNSPLSHYETKEVLSNTIEGEMAESDDKPEIDEGVSKFIEWIRSGKLEIRAYPSQNIHAKVYIMTFKEGDRDVGRVITGSSNFTQAGLAGNLEFNVELKNRNDYEFALNKFNELWQNAVDVSEKYVQTINEKTWLNNNITPYELYLKFLYEYFKDELSKIDDITLKYLPDNFKELEYQRQAVINAKRILEEYGGVFISDVVGLGKTYMAVLLARELDGRTMVIAPPALLNRANPGSWRNVFSDFNYPAEFFSIGKLDDAKNAIESREYRNIIIDESHRFRNEMTLSYEDIAEICRGKRVILISATPYNNTPQDILSQIKLFQNPKNSNIPGQPNLDLFFSSIQTNLKAIDRKKDYNKYLTELRKYSKEIREKVLKYIMVRRTRSEIEKYFETDLAKNGIVFPEVKDPIPFYYQLNNDEDKIFMQTVEFIAKKITYARYTSLLYLKDNITPLQKQAQKNMGTFMKVLLVKRLESSFYAFKNTIDRFIDSYKKYIQEIEKGNVYISKKYSNKIFELIEEGDDEAVQRLLEEGKAEKYNSNDFDPKFYNDLQNDLKILKQIKKNWSKIQRDPKVEQLIKNLKSHPVLKNNKIIIFTESKETAEYLVEIINSNLKNKALLFHGSTQSYIRDMVIDNFDARAKNPQDKYQILVTTDVLAEGVNLHRSNIVINYDIPWNPTKLMQRIGRINRIDTPFKEVYTFNFFPTSQSEDQIKLTKIARSKIESFLKLLGGDAAILTEGEPVESHQLFDKLLSKQTLIGEEDEESELKYLRVIENVRDNNPEIFEKIKRLPKKSRSAKISGDISIENVSYPFLLTFFRKGKLMKFYYSDNNKSYETDFITTVKIFESNINDVRIKIPLKNFYELLDKNKTAFINSTVEEYIPITKRGGKDNINKLLVIIKVTQKNSKQLTEEQEEYLKKLKQQLEQGAIPNSIVKKTLYEMDKLKNELLNPIKVLEILQYNIPSTFLKSHYVESNISLDHKREIILSLFVESDRFK